MTIPPAEQNIRRTLPITRWIGAYLPLSVARWLERVIRAVTPAGITRELVTADDVPCEWLIPDGSPTDQALLYLHGGGFVYGWSNPHRQMVGYLAKQMGVRVLGVDYRLAPEHPFPAGLDDCVTAYRWLIKQGFAAQNLTIAGDSAGGNFTLTSLLKLRDEGDPLPAAAACLSPATDMTPRDDFLQEYDAILHPRAVRLYHSAYVGDHDPHDPLLSPVYGDLHGLPPILIHAGGDEALREDAVRFAERAKQAGVDLRLEVYPRMWHVWQIAAPALPQAVESLNDIAQFLKSHMSISQTQPAA